MLHRANSPSAPSLPQRNNRRVRGSGRGGGGGSSSTKGYFLFIALFATMLLSRVAGQSMTCAGDSTYVESSIATLALNSIGLDDVTFTQVVGDTLIKPPTSPSFLYILSTHLQTSVPPTDGVHSAL